MRAWMAVGVGLVLTASCAAKPAPVRPNPAPRVEPELDELAALDALRGFRKAEPALPRSAPPREASEVLPPTCIGGNCVHGNGMRWTRRDDAWVLEVGHFERSRLVDGEVHVALAERTYAVAISNGGLLGILDRPTYQIRLVVGEQGVLSGPTDGTVVLRGRSQFRVRWDHGIIEIRDVAATALVPGALDDELAVAVQVADDLALPFRQGQLLARLLGSKPELVLVSRGSIEVIAGLGRVLGRMRVCLNLEVCQVTIEGPKGERDTAVWKRGLWVRRPVLARGPADWRQIVTGRSTRIRDDLTAARDALAEARQQLASASTGHLAASREALRRARANLVDALDALDDTMLALPSAHAAGPGVEALRIASRLQRANLELAIAALDGSDSPPRMAVELQKILDIPKLEELARDADALPINSER